MSAPAVDVVRCDCGNSVPPGVVRCDWCLGHEDCTVPAGVMVTSARWTGAPLAVCAWCDWRCGYWDCACDLAHDCAR